MDNRTRRLFVGCRPPTNDGYRKHADTGKINHHGPTGDGTDATRSIPGTDVAFSSNGEGTLTVVHEDSPEKFSVLENVPTKKSARTRALDLKTHNIFLPAADFDAPAAGERRAR